MRHRVYGKKLGRTRNERTALFKNLVQSLIISGSIETTEVKAKSIKGLVDKLVNQAKTPATRRLVSQFLTNKKFSEELIKNIAPRLRTRNSGYTSVVRVGKRLGDSSMIVRMSLLTTPKVEKPAVKKVSEEKKTKPAKTVKAPVRKVK